MNEWWNQLTSLERIFWGIALFASIFQILMFFAAMLGSGHDFDHDPAAHGGDGAAGAKPLSIRAVVAGAVGFGWAGVLALSGGVAPGMAIAWAALSGVLFMLLIFGAMRFLFALRDDGTLDYRNAVGATGKVYVTIPARRSGPGQIEVMVQGRLITANAITDSSAALSPQSPVRVSGCERDNTLIVEPDFAGMGRLL